MEHLESLPSFWDCTTSDLFCHLSWIFFAKPLKKGQLKIWSVLILLAVLFYPPDFSGTRLWKGVYSLLFRTRWSYWELILGANFLLGPRCQQSYLAPLKMILCFFWLQLLHRNEGMKVLESFYVLLFHVLWVKKSVALDGDGFSSNLKMQILVLKYTSDDVTKNIGIPALWKESRCFSA